MEVLFPRGKPEIGPSSGPKKKKKADDSSDRLFIERNDPTSRDAKKKAGQKKKRSDYRDESLREFDQSDVRELLENEKSLRVEFFHQSAAREGTSLLGCVQDIRGLQLIVSLPHCTTGQVQANQISEEYTSQIRAHLSNEGDMDELASLKDMFEVGDLIVCSVLKQGTARSIQLTLYPDVVNKYLSAVDLFVNKIITGAVKSKEDHGYTINVGISDVKAFLPYKECDKKDIVVGTVLRLLVTSVRGDGKIIIVSSKFEKVTNSVISPTQNVSLDALQPGNFGLFKPLSKDGVGMLGKIFGFNSSITSVDYSEADIEISSPADAEEDVPLGKKRRTKKKKSIMDTCMEDIKSFKCCVMYVNPLTKHVALCANPLVMDANARREYLKEKLPDLPTGTKCNLELAGTIRGFGAVFETDFGVKGFGHSRHLSDQKFLDFAQALGEQKKFKARIMQNVTVDGVLGVTLRKSVVDNDYYSYDNITPGTLLECTVREVLDEGLVVKVGKDKYSPIRGFVSKIHLADVILSHPERLFSTGDVITCRVLEVDKERERVKFTRKKTLVNSKLPIVTEYEQLERDMIVHGFVSSVRDSGIFVNFYNNVYGYVPKSELAAEFIDDPQKTFFVGQVVKCRVVFCRVDEEKARLSLILKRAEKRFGTQSTKDAVVSLKVVDKSDSGFSVVTLTGERKGFLPVMHLSDFPSLARGWHGCVKVGDTIDNCVQVNGRENVFTKKSSFVQRCVDPECKNLSFDDLEEGLLTTGFISRQEDYGVFVQLPGGLRGLCPKSKMADQFTLSTEGNFEDGQTVVAKVVELDQDKKRFLVSLKESDCKSMDQGFDIDVYSKEFASIFKLSNPKWSRGLGVGDVFSVTISRAQGKRVCTCKDFPADFSCHIVEDVDSGSEKSETVDAVMLRVDFAVKAVYLSSEKSFCGTKNARKKGDVLPWEAMSVDEDVAILISRSKTERIAAACMTRDFPGQSYLRKSADALKEGDFVKGAVSSTECGTVFVDTTQKDLKRAIAKVTPAVKKEVSECSDLSDAQFGGLKVGDEVTGVIKTVRPTHFLIRIDDARSEGQILERTTTGRLHYSELPGPLKGHFSMAVYKPSADLTGTVIGFRDVRTRSYLAITNRGARSCFAELSKREVPLSLNLQIGDDATVFFKKYDPETETMHVEASPKVTGHVPLLLYAEYPLAVVKLTKSSDKPYALHCVVHKMRSHAISFAGKGAMIDRNTRADTPDIKAGCVTNGMVERKFGDKALVRLPYGFTGTVHVTNCSDDFSEDVFGDLRTGKIVRCCVLECTGKRDLVLSMRRSHLMPDGAELEIADPLFGNSKEIAVGMKLRGFVSSLSKAGLFVQLSRTVAARAALPKMSKYFFSDIGMVEKVFRKGRLVTCAVIGVTEIEGKVAVSLLESDTGAPDLVPESLGLELRTGKKVDRAGRLVDRVEGRRGRKRTVSESADKLKAKKVRKTEDADSGLDEDISPAEMPALCKIVKNPVRDEDDPGFSWEPETQTAEIKSESSSDEEEEEEVEVAPPPKKTKRDRKLAEKRREDEIRSKEDRLLQDNTPQTVEEWDKLAVSSPQNSLIWVSYMTFHLFANDIERARAVAERALKTIDFREEKERWNVWAALLNLENRFGDDDSISDTVRRACQRNDPLKVNLHMVSAYEKSDKFPAAEDLCKKMVKKFKQNKTVWMLYVSHLMRRGMRERADEIFKRSLQSLEKSAHLEAISKFAQLEYRYGDAEHGRVLFENALASYPRRADIWSIYIDMLTKNDLTTEARDVFERVTTMNFSTKNMKSFFKKYLEFESRFGSEKLVLRVKQRALEYIQSKTVELEE